MDVTLEDSYVYYYIMERIFLYANDLRVNENNLCSFREYLSHSFDSVALWFLSSELLVCVQVLHADGAQLRGSGEAPQLSFIRGQGAALSPGSRLSDLLPAAGDVLSDLENFRDVEVLRSSLPYSYFN